MIKQVARVGFTLIELIIVIVVIGILAAMVVPRFASAQSEVSVASAAEDILGMAKAMEHHNTNKGFWPAETAAGAMPPEVRDNFKGSNPFTKICPISGVYDYDNKVSGGVKIITISIQPSATSSAPSITDALALDAFLDDGVLNSGRFQSSGKGYSFRVSQ